MKPNNAGNKENESVTGSNQPSNGMSRFRLFLKWFTYKDNITVCAFAAIIFMLHLLTISKPPVMMFDEQTYVPEANSFLSGSGLIVPEHPPLSKWFIAAGISIFGNDAFGWRIFGVISGVVSIVIFYLICVYLVRKEGSPDENVGTDAPELTQSKSWFTMITFVPVFATFLFAFENMSFVQASIAMLDVFSVTFMLLGFLLYLRNRYVWCGVVIGLSMLCKMPAVLAVIAILLHWGITHRHEIGAEIRKTKYRQGGQKNTHHAILPDMGKFLIAAALVWIVLLPLLEYPATYQLANPFSRLMYMLHFNANYNVTLGNNPNATTPWQWIIHPTNIVYWPGDIGYANGHFILPIDAANPLYYASVNWNIWALIIISMLFLSYEVIRYRKIQHPVAEFALAWFFAVFVLLIPIELVSGRLMYTYYLYPAIPVVCLAIAWSAWKLWLNMKKERKRRTVFLSLLAIHTIGTLVIFFLMSPFGGHFLFPG